MLTPIGRSRPADLYTRRRNLLDALASNDWERSGAGSPTVEITLEPDGDGTLLQLVHRDLPPEEAPRHGEGWEHYLPLLAGTLRLR